MKMTGQTILITGGTSGIGLALATQLLALGNTVIVTGRRLKALEEAKLKLPALHTLQSDVSNPAAVAILYQEVIGRFPNLNVLINNAGIMRRINLQQTSANLPDLTREIEINLNGLIWTAVQFLPHLKMQKEAAIVNVSSGLAFVPLAIAPIYSVSKAAVHAFTQSLRIQLKKTQVRVFELAPPGTETPLFHAEFTDEDGGGLPLMDVETLARKAITGIEKDTLEIRPGLSNVLKLMSRIAPGTILKQLSKSVDRMLAET